MLNMTAMPNIVLAVTRNITVMPKIHPIPQGVTNWATFIERIEDSSLVDLDLKSLTEVPQNTLNPRETMDISGPRNPRVRILPYLAIEFPLAESQTRGLHPNRLRK